MDTKKEVSGDLFMQRRVTLDEGLKWGSRETGNTPNSQLKDPRTLRPCGE